MTDVPMRHTLYLALPNRPAADSWHLDKRRIRVLPLCWATLAPASRGWQWSTHNPCSCSKSLTLDKQVLHQGEPRYLHSFKALHWPSLFELLSYTHFWKMLISLLAGLIFKWGVLSEQRIYTWQKHTQLPVEVSLARYASKVLHSKNF